MSNGKKQKLKPRAFSKKSKRVMEFLKCLLFYTVCILIVTP